MDNIQHFYMQVDKRDKVELLLKLAYVEDFRGLAFFNSLSDLGSAEENYNTVVLRPYRARQRCHSSNTVRSFWNASKTTAGPCWPTDWSLRGIDIEHLECVINYDIPRDVETYAHRAGRTLERMGAC